MCQYSAVDGVMSDWHLVHLGSRAVGGAGLVLFEATAVSPEGRITPHDSGIWNTEQAQRLKGIVEFVRAQGSVAGLQLAHAGRKASAHRPWDGGGALSAAEGAWQTVAPSAVSFDADRAQPEALDEAGLEKVLADFVAAAGRAHQAGFQLLEVHSAHGYLLHSFLSPLSNQRHDQYGGTLENRMRFPLRVVEAVRAAWPEGKPLWVRISASDWVDGGWTLKDSVKYSGRLKEIGVDLVDCSSGGLVPEAQIETGPGYQVQFAATIKRETGLATAAVGQITSPQQAETIVRSGQADMVLLARELLRDPYWPQRARVALGLNAEAPQPYQRAHSRSFGR